jgi:hypothetical protein
MSEANGVRRLPLAHVEERPALADMVERHPNDGWRLCEPLTVSPATERALHGLVRALLPPPPAPRSPELDAHVARHVRVMLMYMPPTMRLGFLLIVRLLELAPIWRFAAFSRLSSLDPARGSKILQGLTTSSFMLFRLLMLAPKAVVLSTYFDTDEAHRALGYEPKGFLRERIARREQLVAEEQAALAQDSKKENVGFLPVDAGAAP